ncbi:MAG: hypothetical protein HY514_03940 [Candidatus Aenigmarchaeota archaeon]|nr:hypothetical protein [Candidatus Aenigmarchaeota archaeon]
MFDREVKHEKVTSFRHGNNVIEMFTETIHFSVFGVIRLLDTSTDNNRKKL